ncbi:MAG: SH3 domain-containing protein [Sulfuricurvum sp.]|nr:SH3 domain-containing protein [Sulfuricurvum sp.]
MRLTIWISSIVLLLGGCTTHLPIDPPVLLKQIQPITKNIPIQNDSLCADFSENNESSIFECGPKISDLVRFEQSIVPYAEQNIVDHEDFLETQYKFEQHFFSPWTYTMPPISLQEATWPIRAFKGGYGSNLRPVPITWFKELEDQSNFDMFGQLNQKAITLKWMDIRVLPSDKPLYKDPKLPGEGYPFDYLQNSSVNYNEPVFISHTSKDGAWSYIFTNNASGWVKSDGLSIVNNATIEKIEKAEKVFILDDDIPLHRKDSKFIAYTRIGMVLPLDHVDNENYYVNVIDENNTLINVSIPLKSAHIGISHLNKKDLIQIGAQLLKNTYGWGGMYHERDCSSMIRDMYTPFGIWLPRNSLSQSHKGEVISFSELSNDEKLTLIKEKGIPFETIIYLKGHVLLYIGTFGDNVMVMHNVWGIRTIDKFGNTGRYIIGKAVISTLELGKDLADFDPAMKLLTRIESMNIFTHTTIILASKDKGTKNQNPRK